MAKKFSELRAGMTQAARERSDAKAQVMLADMQQPPIAEIEKRIDIYRSTLRSHIGAMSGQLDANSLNQASRATTSPPHKN
jgi:hypothetical protein